MTCIPFIQWQDQSGESSRFADFKLCVSDDLAESLRADLSWFSVAPDSNNFLCLEIMPDPQGSEEAYTLTIFPNHVEITSPTARGLHHGLTSLKLLLATGEHVLPFGHTRAVPDFPNRGIMLDVSRGKMPTLDYLKQLIGVMADLKYNILQLYSEDKLALKKHPSVGCLTGAYTEAQIRELDACARERFVELQPCIQTFSHMHGVLRLPGYSHLAENDALFSFAAGNEAVYDYLEDVFSETLPWFSSKTLNINLDEAYDLGTGYSKATVDALGKEEVLLAHIQRVIVIARKYGAEKILLWGDFAVRHPELVSRLPENTVILDWNYNPLPRFPTLEVFQKAGIPFWAVGGVSTWNSIFPRVYNAYTNLIGLSCEAYQLGASGFLVTDWGDYGHPQPLGLSLYGYIIGAQQAFSARAEDPCRVEREIWPLIFSDKRIGQAFRLLMDSNLAPHVQTDFKTMSFYYLFDDMLDGLTMNGSENYPRLDRESFEVLVEKGASAWELLRAVEDEKAHEHHAFPDENWGSLFGPLYLCALTLSARMTRFTGLKGQAAFRIRDALKKPDVSRDDILALILEIRELYHEFLTIRREFEAVWLARAYPTGIESCLSLFDRAGAQMAETVKWLALQLQALARGEAPDAELKTYTAARDYGILWTADFKNMWDRAYPWQ